MHRLGQRCILNRLPMKPLTDELSMHPQISCLFSLAVKPEEFPVFKALIANIVAATSTEPGTLVYEYSANEDNSTVHILERYNADAVVSHVDTTFAPFGKRFLELCTVTSLVVYGTPDAEIRKRLDPFGAVYMTPFDGFSR
jgi:quinol monooxygenase YgiN